MVTFVKILICSVLDWYTSWIWSVGQVYLSLLDLNMLDNKVGLKT